MDVPSYFGVVFAVDALAFFDPRECDLVGNDVVKDVDEFSIAVGNPAKVIRKRI